MAQNPKFLLLLLRPQIKSLQVNYAARWANFSTLAAPNHRHAGDPKGGPPANKFCNVKEDLWTNLLSLFWLPTRKHDMQRQDSSSILLGGNFRSWFGWSGTHKPQRLPSLPLTCWVLTGCQIAWVFPSLSHKTAEWWVWCWLTAQNTEKQIQIVPILS